MFKRLPVLALLAFGLLAAHVAGAASAPIPAAPAINADAYYVVEQHSGRVIAEKESRKQVEPASITKLMTAYVTFKKLRAGQISLDDQVLVSEKAWRTEGSRMWIEVNSKVRLEDLMRGMIVQSGNDAAVALAEHIAGGEDTFVALMNQYALDLGLRDTVYYNSTGLPAEGHLTTAYDIAVLTQHLIAEFPEYYHWYSEKSFTYNEIEQFNRNSLLWRDQSVDGVKTGHTEAAGFCLVSSAKRGEMRVVSVVLGTPSKEARADSSRSLLNYAFNFYETHKLYEAGAAITTERVFKGARDDTSLGLRDDLYVTIPRGQYDQLKASLKLPEMLIAPLNVDKAHGQVIVELDEETVASAPLFSLEPVAQGSLFRRAVDEVRLWFE